MIDTIKISANPEKVSTPGLKRIYRIINKETQKSEGDYIAMEEEDVANQKGISYPHLYEEDHNKF